MKAAAWPMAVGQSTSADAVLSWRDGARYGLLGTALAFVALPLYVVLPGHYATQFGAPLAALGAILLAARLLDALIDPWLGRWADASLAQSRRSALGVAALAAAALATGFAALFFPPRLHGAPLLAWCAAMLVLTYLGFSTLTVLHQAWGARLGGDARFRAQVVSWREGCALVGVMTASLLPSLLGMPATTLTLAVLLALGLAALAGGPFRSSATAADMVEGRWNLPWTQQAFRTLLAIYMLNGIASAIPATLVLFFVRDRLGAEAHTGALLALYFASAAASFPLWLRLIEVFGLARCWLAGMALAVASFGWAAGLGSGDAAAFAVICIGTGLALGADLAAPNAMLTGVIQRAGHGQRHEGRYAGWWTAATKLNLALAAGVALPTLAALGYQPGARDPDALQALTMAYAVVPCAMKVAAGRGLWLGMRRRILE